MGSLSVAACSPSFLFQAYIFWGVDAQTAAHAKGAFLMALLTPEYNFFSCKSSFIQFLLNYLGVHQFVFSLKDH